jgi:hypothetical protein
MLLPSWQGKKGNAGGVRSQTSSLKDFSMSSVDLDFELPNWDVPPNRPNQISVEAWLEWLEENRRELIRTGQLEKMRNDPLRCPVDVRFEL